MKSKKDYRNEAFSSLNYKLIDEKSKKIVNIIRNDSNYINARFVAIYYPLKHEANLLDLLNDNKTFLFPKIIGKRIMEFIVIDSNTKWKINKFGINEPISGKILNEEIDLFLVSSLGRNSKNYRLGHGGGYYDTYFSKYHNNIKVGILLNNNVYNFKESKYDIKFDYFIHLGSE